MNADSGMRGYRRVLSALSPFLLLTAALGGCAAPTPLNGAFRKAMARYGISVFFVPDAQGLIYYGGSIHCVTNEQVKP